MNVQSDEYVLCYVRKCIDSLRRGVITDQECVCGVIAQLVDARRVDLIPRLLTELPKELLGPLRDYAHWLHDEGWSRGIFRFGPGAKGDELARETADLKRAAESVLDALTRLDDETRPS